METLDPLGGQFLILLVIGAILLIGLFIAKIVFRLTMNFIKFGCLVIAVVLLVLFFMMFVMSAV